MIFPISGRKKHGMIKILDTWVASRLVHFHRLIKYWGSRFVMQVWSSMNSDRASANIQNNGMNFLTTLSCSDK